MSLHIYPKSPHLKSQINLIATDKIDRPNLAAIKVVTRIYRALLSFEISAITPEYYTMKFLVAVMAVLAMAGPMNAYDLPNVGNGELAKELQDFLNIIPVDDMVMIVLEYVADDEEFQAAVEYLQSSEFQQLAADVEALPEIVNLMNYIYNAGVDIYYLVNKLNEFIGIEQLPHPQANAFVPYRSGKGIRGFIDDIKAILPVEDLKALYNKKLAESKVWADFVGQLSSPEFQKIVESVYHNEHFKDLLEKAKAAGVDVIAIKELLYQILGITVPSGF